MLERSQHCSSGRRLLGVLALLPLVACSPLGSRSEGEPSDPESALAGSGAASLGGAAGTSGTGGNAGAGSPVGGGSSAAAGSSSSGAGSAGFPAAGGSGTSGDSGVPERPTTACAGLVFEESVDVASYDTDRFSWNDAACKPRQAAMVRVGGGYVRQFVYDVDGTPRIATGTNANNYHTGWGYAVSHFGNGGSQGKDNPGTFTPVFVGTHHALYEYKFSQNIGGQNIPITFHWFFATGRSHPVLAITYDMSASPKGWTDADIRTPYGDIAWDGDENLGSTVVSGLGWGDRYKFSTTSAPLTMNSAWDYTQPNLVPYVIEWTTNSDAEMGAVQTQTYLQHDAGGSWYYSNWGKTSANRTNDSAQVGNMPSTWNWPYQLNQYELCMEQAGCVNNPTNSHRLAWGTNRGAVGGANSAGTYPAFGDDKQLPGAPYQSYSVFMVLGKHSDTPVFGQVGEIERVQQTTLTASVGTVPATGPGGVGRSDEVALAPAGYDARYAVWKAAASGNELGLQANVAQGALVNPVLVVTAYDAAAAPSITLNGELLTPDVDYVVSLDVAAKQAWVTFRVAWAGVTNISVSGN